MKLSLAPAVRADDTTITRAISIAADMRAVLTLVIGDCPLSHPFRCNYRQRKEISQGF
jgi:hypothetical protein